MTTETDQHDGFRDLRQTGEFWSDYGKRMTEGVDLLAALMPDFVRRRYTVTYYYRSEGDEPYGSLYLGPVESGQKDTETANARHADVTKLFNWLLDKRTAPDTTEGAEPQREPREPKRTLDRNNGSITYDFRIDDLPDFPQGLTVTVGGLGAGSACHITKKVTGTHEVEDVEYEMVCDDDPVPAEDAKEVVEATQ